ncbi:NAD-dependent epimerase/dehydratase family protein [Larkinella bovis]|uniref:NAD-dependent epimerase/dehydratase family protein n=1 Tax=Larkinella bovis TaxID=683041 RepID=A0ABW0I9F7_9BACT
MSVLLTGASGFLGQRLYRVLSKTDLVTSLSRQGVGPGHIACNLAVETPDLSPYRFDCVVNAAGKAHSVPRTAGDAADYEQVNVQGLKRLLTALEQSAALPHAFVHMSTILTYGCSAGEVLDENTPLRATDVYGQSKIRAEAVVQEWGAKTGVKTTILRLPLVVAENPRGNLAALIQAIRRGRYVRIGDGSCRRSMVLADDVARIIPKAAHYPGIYNLTDGVHPSVRELEDAIARQVGRRRLPSVPLFAARAVATVGDGINAIVGRRFPLDSMALAKLTQSLTFSDLRARQQLGWDPKPVVSFFE